MIINAQKKSKRKWCWKFSFELTPFDNRYGCRCPNSRHCRLGRSFHCHRDWWWSKKELSSWALFSTAVGIAATVVDGHALHSLLRVFRAPNLAFAMWINSGHFRFWSLILLCVRERVRGVGVCAPSPIYDDTCFSARLFVQPSPKTMITFCVSDSLSSMVVMVGCQ